jgi:alkylation response protein AidB-like acyl-CoA dehydrogenase
VDFEFSADQEMLRASVRRFLADRAPITPYVRGVLAADVAGADEVWKGLAELGLLGLGMVDSAVVLEELGRAVCPVPYVASAVGAVALADGALASDLAAGTIGAVALHEDGARYGWRSPATRAERTSGGWRLHGAKVHVLDGAAADVLVVVASEPGGALGVFAVEGGAATAEPANGVDGTRKQATIHFEGAPGRRIQHADVPAAVGRAVDRMVVATVVDGVGAASRALELAVEYAKERIQFDQPIGAFQAVQHLCADMLQVVELGRAAAYYACWAADDADPGEAHRAATLAGAYAAETFPRLGGTAIQVFGGIGFTWEHDIHLFYKRLLSCATVLGTADDHLAELANLAIG